MSEPSSPEKLLRGSAHAEAKTSARASTRKTTRGASDTTGREARAACPPRQRSRSLKEETHEDLDLGLRHVGVRGLYPGPEGEGE